MSPEDQAVLQNSKAQYGATHYSTMRDGKTPQMLYKQEPIHYNDKTSKMAWVYLSYCGIWMGSSMTDEDAARLKTIN